MAEPKAEQYMFRATYTVAWPIWAGGYPTQERALATVNEHKGELRSLAAARLESSSGQQPELILSWQAMGYQPISGLSPGSPQPNSLKLTIGVLADYSVDTPDIAWPSIAVLELYQSFAQPTTVQELTKDIAYFIKRHMPGAPQGANHYEVVADWLMASPILASELPEAEDSGGPVVADEQVAGLGIALAVSQPVSSVMALRIRPYRYALTLGQLQQLAGSPGNGGEDVIDTYYGWRNDRTAAAVKGMGGAALSLFVAWLVPFLKNEYAKTPLWLVLGPPLLTIFALAVWSLVAVVQLNRIHASYAASAALLQTFR